MSFCSELYKQSNKTFSISSSSAGSTPGDHRSAAVPTAERNGRPGRSPPAAAGSRPRSDRHVLLDGARPSADLYRLLRPVHVRIPDQLPKCVPESSRSTAEADLSKAATAAATNTHNTTAAFFKYR